MPSKLSEVHKLFGGLSNVEVGEEYTTLFMPARWAFAIWGVIYVGEVCAYGKIFMGEASAAVHKSTKYTRAAVKYTALILAAKLAALAAFALKVGPEL